MTDIVEIGYTNWRGEYAVRRIRPERLWFGSTDYHPELQWFIAAVDLDKKSLRDFALTGFGNSHVPAEWVRALLRDHDTLTASLAVARAETHANFGAGLDLMLDVTKATEALAEAEAEVARLKAALHNLTSAVGNMRVPQTIGDAALQVMVTIGPALQEARAALAEPPTEDKT